MEPDFPSWKIRSIESCLQDIEIGTTRSGSHKIGFEERLDVLRFHHVRTNHRLVALLCGAIAQLEERLICIQEVVGSIPIGSTNRTRVLGS